MQRHENESFAAYKQRRAADQKHTERVLRGVLIQPIAGTNRRHRVKAAGGIRQFKRAQYPQSYPGYADRHGLSGWSRRLLMNVSRA